MTSTSKIKEGDFIKNLFITLDIDCHRRVISKKGFFKKLSTGDPATELVWDNFDIFQVSGNLIRALKTGGFISIQEFLIDGEYIFAAKESDKGKKINDAVKLLTAESELRKRYKQFSFKSITKNNTVCNVKIMRQHTTEKPAVTLKFKGTLGLEQCRAIIRQIQKDLETRRIETKPEFDF